MKVDKGVDRDPVTVVIAEGAADVRMLLRIRLESDRRFHVMDDVGDCASALQALRQHRPDVAVFDLHMKGMADLVALHEAKAASPGTAVVVLAGTYDRRRDPDLDAAPIAGWTMKDEIMGSLPDVLASVSSPD